MNELARERSPVPNGAVSPTTLQKQKDFYELGGSTTLLTQSTSTCTSPASSLGYSILGSGATFETPIYVECNLPTPRRETVVTSEQQESDEEREKHESKVQREKHELKVQRSREQAQCDRKQRLVQPVRTNRIRLNVYDLIANETIMELPWGFQFPIGEVFNAVNTGLHTLGTGAYHVGIEINDVEYAYGGSNNPGKTGIFTCMPKNSPGYQYRSSIDFGSRIVNRDESHIDGREIIREMAPDYMGLDYDLLRKNCCTFAHDACLRMGIEENEIPTWFTNLASAGALTQDAATFTMEPLTKVLSACDVDAAFGDDSQDTKIENVAYEVLADGSNGTEEYVVETSTRKALV